MSDTNAILRGGPADGKRVHVDHWGEHAEHGPDGSVSVYITTGDQDDEYTTLGRFEFNRTEPPSAGTAFRQA